MIFKIYECDFGVKLDGVTYDFTHVNEVTIEDPEMNKLTRGANASNKIGLVYKEGLKEPKKITVTIMDMAADLKAALDAAFADKTRLDVFCVDRNNGSSKLMSNAVLSQQPQQLSLNDSAESMNVALAFESFDLVETFKGEEA